VLSGLLLSAFLMGLGGMAHCAAMCGVACTAIPGGLPWTAMLGRSLGYAALGALAAASAGLVAQLGRQVGFLQPFWIMLLVAAVVLGVWLAVSGRMPAVMDQWGLDVYRRARARWQQWAARHDSAAWRPVMPLVAGMFWAFLPCGLLYAALMLATLAPTPAGGAAVMLAFSVPSALGVWAAPWVLRKLIRRASPAADAPVTAPAPSAPATTAAPVVWLRSVGVADGAAPGQGAASGTRPQSGVQPGVPSGSAWLDPRWAIRLAGLSMAAMAAWAVSHHLWAQYQAWCA
jgi:sulfite exporter TauE/SafE